MARTNKYSSLNFNEIYEKKIVSTTPSSLSSKSPCPSSSSSFSSNKSYSFSASARLGHGGMLVLSRPSPSPKPSPSPSPPSPSPSPTPPSLATPPSTPPAKADSISLRPLGKTGSAPARSLVRENHKDRPSSSVLPKTDKFVPPHLRPGYVARELTPVPPPPKPGNYRPGSGHGHHGENGRPKSGGGGGYDRRVRGVGAPATDWDLIDFHRPRSGGSRPNTSGW